MIREQELETKLVSMQTAIDGARQLATESMLVSKINKLNLIMCISNYVYIYVGR